MSLIVNYYHDKLLPSTEANTINRIEMARAFAQQKSVSKVEFYFLSDRWNPQPQDLNLIGLKKLQLRSTFVPGLRAFENPTNLGGKLLKRLMNRYINFKFFWHFLLLRNPRERFIYLRSRDQLIPCYYASLIRRYQFAFELHDFKMKDQGLTSWLYKKMMHRAKLLVTIHEQTKNNWISRGIDATKILILPSGVNLDAFKHQPASKDELRTRLGINPKKFVAMYAGSLGELRGIEDMLQAAEKLPQIDLHIVGGKPEEIKRWKQLLPALNNVIWHGQQPHVKVPEFLHAADVLLAPYSVRHPNADHFSPIKLFEYLATGIPIVTSDIQATRDQIDVDYLFLNQSDDAASLAEQIARIHADYPAAVDKAKRGAKYADKYSYGNRVQSLLAAIK